MAFVKTMIMARLRRHKELFLHELVLFVCQGTGMSTDVVTRVVWEMSRAGVLQVAADSTVSAVPVEPTLTLPEPPDGTRLEFEWCTDVYAVWRCDASSREAGWTAGDGGEVWMLYPDSVPRTWASLLENFGDALATATVLVRDPSPELLEEISHARRRTVEECTADSIAYLRGLEKALLMIGSKV